MDTRYCRKCKRWKLATEFYKNSRGGCKQCIQASHREWRLKKYPPKPKLIDSGLRRCGKCHEIKLLSEFYRYNRYGKEGYQYKCKACSNAARKVRKQREYQAREKIQEGFKKCKKCDKILPVSEFRQGRNGVYHSPCKDCIREYRQEYNSRNPDKRREYQSKPEVKEKANARRREWAKNNPEYQARQKAYRTEYQRRPQVKAKNKAHNARYRDDPERKEVARQRTIDWRKNNPELARYQRTVKDARKRNAEGSHDFEQWQMLLSFFDCCPRCGENKPLTCDHIIPLVQGGTNYLDNIQALCRSCNSSKNMYQIVDYRPKEARRWVFAEMSFVYL